MICHALKDEVVEIEALEKAGRIYGLHHNMHIKPAEPHSATGGSIAMTLNCHCPTEDGDQELLKRDVCVSLGLMDKNVSKCSHRRVTLTGNMHRIKGQMFWCQLSVIVPPHLYGSNRKLHQVGAGDRFRATELN